MNPITPQPKQRVFSARIISTMPRGSATRPPRPRLSAPSASVHRAAIIRTGSGPMSLSSGAASRRTTSRSRPNICMRPSAKARRLSSLILTASRRWTAIGFLRLRNRRLFGTKLADDFYQVNIGGDIAFMNGVMKHWFEMETESAWLGDRPCFRARACERLSRCCKHMWSSRAGRSSSVRPD